MAVFGLDFGTTNSLAAIADGGRVTALVGRDDRPHPSVVWYHGATRVVGREAKSRVETLATGVVGEFVRSPKTYLGTGDLIYVGGRTLTPTEVIADVLAHVRKDAVSRGLQGHGFDRAVITIPVNLAGAGRRELRAAAELAGIRVEQFVHEPLAALYAHVRARENHDAYLAGLRDRLLLVFDWGGGTLDLTLCRFKSGMLMQVQNVGNNQVGGDRFDDLLVQHVLDRHGEHHGIRERLEETEGARARILEQSEIAKIDLSTRDSHTIFVKNCFRTTGPAQHLEVTITRAELESLTADLVQKGLVTIDQLLGSAGQPDQAITLCLATGGMVQMPLIRQKLMQRFGVSRLEHARHGDRIIAEGAAWIAADRVRAVLAKPVELLDADNSYVPIIKSGVILPREGEQQPYPLNLYCADPRDGLAKIQLARPKHPDQTQPSHPRQVYTTLTLEVHRRARPLVERIELAAMIDPNLVLYLEGRSTVRGDTARAEIHDLEFGIHVWGTERADDSRRTRLEPVVRGIRPRHYTAPGAVAVRSNVTFTDTDERVIPGELLKWDRRHVITDRQEEEHMYYKPCLRCDRNIYQIEEEGCTDRSCPASESGLGQPMA